MNEPQPASAAAERTLYPAFRYEDARAAIDFLVAAFGFTEHVVYADDAGIIIHAELLFGDGMIMLGQARDDGSDYGKIVTTPKRAGGVTGSVYAYAADPDALYARAAGAGAEAIKAPYDTDYGSRETIFRDLEGYVWTFGTYRP